MLGGYISFLYIFSAAFVTILDSNGTAVVQYKYDAWGKPISKTGSMAGTLGTVQPFRYRGYVYDEETGLYYLCSRYYVPSTSRFLSSDEENCLGINNDFAALNLSAYCGNNPITREDSNGRFWLISTGLKMIGGAVSQWAGDIIANVVEGKTGAAIFERRSSWGDYIAAAITAAIPGSGISGALISNAISQTISIIEDAINGEKIDIVSCLIEIGLDVLLDSGFETIAKYVSDIIGSNIPKNYSSYAHKVRKTNPGLSKEQVSRKMSHSIRATLLAQDTTEYTFDCIRASIAF